MNFQKLRTVEKSDFYLDVAFSRAKKETDAFRSQFKLGNYQGAKVKKAREVELKRMKVVKDVLEEQFAKILESYPNIDNLDEFYIGLIKCTLDYSELKKSLGAVSWARRRVLDLNEIYSEKVKRSTNPEAISKMRREYYGRVSSFVKQINKSLIAIENGRKVMANYPMIKPKMFTVAIAGFPNVGKSTILSKITTAKPEVNSYAFTTKSLMLGYMREEGEGKKRGIQIIDTPGTLNRFNKMNDIEKQAHLAVKHLTNLIVFVFDPTDTYDVDDQEKLLERMKEYDLPIIIYLSKTDIADKEKIDAFKRKHKEIITDSAKLKKELKDAAKGSNVQEEGDN